MSTLNDKVIFITGASRGIGREIALRCARDGAKVVIAAKSTEPGGRLPGTIHSVAAEVEQAGGKALAVVVDVRDEQTITDALAQTVAVFGGIDILVNNASAISLTDTEHTLAKKFDLMFGVNVRATFLVSQACLPHLKRATNPHILNLSPPLNMDSKWFKDHLAYTMSKYGMSLCTLGMAAEFKEAGIAVNSLWPRTLIATMAIKVHFPAEMLAGCRTPAIVAAAAHHIVTQNARTASGNFFIDEDVLRGAGVEDFGQYAVEGGGELLQDLFLE